MTEALCNYVNQSQKFFKAEARTPGSIEIRSPYWISAEDIDVFASIAEEFGLRPQTWVAKAMSNGDLVFEFQMEDLERVPN